MQVASRCITILKVRRLKSHLSNLKKKIISSEKGGRGIKFVRSFLDKQCTFVHTPKRDLHSGLSFAFFHKRKPRCNKASAIIDRFRALNNCKGAGTIGNQLGYFCACRRVMEWTKCLDGFLSQWGGFADVLGERGGGRDLKFSFSGNKAVRRLYRNSNTKGVICD